MAAAIHRSAGFAQNSDETDRKGDGKNSEQQLLSTKPRQAQGLKIEEKEVISSTDTTRPVHYQPLGPVQRSPTAVCSKVNF